MINKIGHFQLDNLIKNRIPFLLLNMTVDISNSYLSIYKDLVIKNQTLIKVDEILKYVEVNSVPFDAAVILLCGNGEDSLVQHKKLEKLGYTNVYVIDGGYQQMMTEHLKT